jgi:hypothetical protein
VERWKRTKPTVLVLSSLQCRRRCQRRPLVLCRGRQACPAYSILPNTELSTQQAGRLCQARRATRILQVGRRSLVCTGQGRRPMCRFRCSIDRRRLARAAGPPSHIRQAMGLSWRGRQEHMDRTAWQGIQQAHQVSSSVPATHKAVLQGLHTQPTTGQASHQLVQLEDILLPTAHRFGTFHLRVGITELLSSKPAMHLTALEVAHRSLNSGLKVRQPSLNFSAFCGARDRPGFGKRA